MQNLLPVFFKTVAVVCTDWENNYAAKWGFKIDTGRKSIKRAHFFVIDLFSQNPALPPNPGPFKVAAAFLVSAMHFIEFDFYPLENGRVLTHSEKKLWKSRFLLRALPVFLLQLELTSTGEKLKKTWDTPSVHYRLDFLNFVRWCEFPLDGPPDPPPPNKPTVDMVRVNRLVMAMTLIIEACYYIVGNEVACDVKDKIHINLEEMDPLIRPDLDFDAPAF